MNYLVQRGKVRQQVINVPDGLPELLSDITREVLRCQPTTECLCQFIIDYLHSIIVTRDKANLAKAIIDRALRSVDEIISDMCICDIPAIKAEELAMAMEECFKRFLEKRRCERRKEHEIVKFEEWDMLNELIEKCKFTEHDLQMSRPIIEDAYNRFVEAYMAAAEGTDGTEALYEYFKQREFKRLEDEKMTAAAIKIQACFRGYLARRNFLFDKPCVQDQEYEYYYDTEKVQAAIKIQRFWRRFCKHKCLFERYQEEEEAREEDGSSIEVCSPKSMLSVRTEPKSQTSKQSVPEKADGGAGGDAAEVRADEPKPDQGEAPGGAEQAGDAGEQHAEPADQPEPAPAEPEPAEPAPAEDQDEHPPEETN